MLRLKLVKCHLSLRQGTDRIIEEQLNEKVGIVRKSQKNTGVQLIGLPVFFI